ncbi:MAG TPA: prolyl oligopeptidase family serine peptidase [Candidatus Elarobacter sp.]|jgi:prolyl oligopeptidase|nr:prolyl oligopeptidase family serine peptidase [Candidatus Elarobacter sp.]
MSPAAMLPLTYPDAPRLDQIDEYFGRRVADPYRWLEDVDSQQTQRWIAEENALTESVLATVPNRAAIRARLTEVWDYERRSVPEKAGELYAYFRNSGLQNQAVLYVTRDLAEPGRVLLDPNTLSPDGTVALSGSAFSDDGSRLAYAVSSSGSDWQEWHVRDVATGHDLPDIVRWSKFSSAAWRTDGAGFYYSRYDEPASGVALKDPNFNHKLYYHRLGTPQSTDLLVYERPDHKDWNFAATTTEDGRYLLIDVSEGTAPENAVFVKDLTTDGPVIEMISLGDARYGYIANDGPSFYFVTTNGAARGRIIAIDLGDGGRREIVAETADSLDTAAVFGDRIVAQYLHDALARVVVYGLDGSRAGEVQLPGLGSVAGFPGKRTDRETFYSYTSYTEPTSIYRYDVGGGASTRVFRPQIRFDADAFTSEQVFYTSKDGTRVPMIVTAKRGTPRDGSAPAILYGYGGFDISVTPAFSSALLVWLEMGGVYAVANLRGGGEYGESWHRDGMRACKQNTFDDFIAAAEFLVAQNWTTSAKLGIHGGSNGGLLVGACMTQRPELFGAALPSVGVLDMLRFQRFTIGWAWTSDYGSADDPDDVATLLAYSPYHNVRVGVRYPPTLITTGDHDDRVFPAHSFKFAAALQYAQGGDAPVLLRVETKAGHGAGKPTAKLIDEVADRYAFLTKVFAIGA